MKQITFLITVIVLIFVQPDVLAQSLFTTQTKQFGDVEVVTKLYGDEVSNITIISGKRSYQVDNFYGSFKGQKIVGDIKFPKKNSPEYKKMQNNGTFAVNTNVNKKIVGLKAPFIQLIPDLGLVGFEIHGGWEQRDAYKNGKINVALGRVIWQLNLATGEVKGIEKDEVVMFNPYHRIYSTRLLYLGQNSPAENPTTTERMVGYYLEDNKLIRKWENLSVMAPPRSTGHLKPKEKRYYRYLDDYVQIADRKEGETYEIVVFDDNLREKNNYYPSLLVYRNYDNMPDYKTSSVSHIRGVKLVEDYRSGKGLGPDELFHRQALVPSQDIEGLYGVLRADGTVEIPKGSLGLSPVITIEKDAKSKTGETYLLSHYFLVAYPGGDDGNMKYAVANTVGELSYGSEDQPVWKQFIIYDSDIIKKHNSHSFYHSELVVAQLPDGLWQCYLPTRYRSQHSPENLSYSFPKPIAVGKPHQTEIDAISEAEKILVQIDEEVGKYRAEQMAIKKAEDRERWNKHLEIIRKREEEEWAKLPKPVKRTGGIAGLYGSWKGFTYTSQTTSRYNQAVNQSNYNNQMRQYNNYLNSRIYRKW